MGKQCQAVNMDTAMLYKYVMRIQDVARRHACGSSDFQTEVFSQLAALIGEHVMAHPGEPVLVDEPVAGE
jgi:hypothetical protein